MPEQQDTGRDFNDPSPAEIERRAKKVREKWSERQRRKRSAKKQIPWIPPIVPLTDFPSETTDSEA